MRPRFMALLTVLSLAGPAAAQPTATPPGTLPQFKPSPTQQPQPTAPPAAQPQPAATYPAASQPIPSYSYTSAPAAVDPTRFWVSGEALGWWVQGQNVPALITTSPAGTPLGSAGVLGSRTTSVLAGNERFNDDMRFGGRFTAGAWLDDCHKCGIGAEFFILTQNTDRFTTASQGNPILARPFNTFPGGQPNAQIIAFPGVAVGGANIDATNDLLGAGVFGLCEICSGVDCCGCERYRVLGLAGYRYLRLEDQVGIAERVTAASTIPGGVPVGTTFLVSDTFRTVNQFHGGDIGLAGRVYRGPVFLDLMGRLGIGANVRDLTATGGTVIAAPGLQPASFPGGLLAQGAGTRYSDCEFALVPELRASLGYRVSNHLDVFVGYNVMWWTNVIRAGDQIDLRVNPGLLPPPIVSNGRPLLPVQDTTIWVQGISLGAVLRF